MILVKLGQMSIVSIRKLKRTNFSHFQCPNSSSLVYYAKPFPLLIFLQTHFPYHSLSSQTRPNSESPELYKTVPVSSSQRLTYYGSILQSCISQKALVPGKQLHAHLCQMGIGYNTVLATKLVDLYCVCNALGSAQFLFEKIPKRNLFLWNVLIRGYAWNGPYEIAIELYGRLIGCGLLPDNFTFTFVLKACSALLALDEGRAIHEWVIRNGWESDVFVGAALIDMYAKCGRVDDACHVFEEIAVKDAVLWNSMLAACSQNGKPDESIALCSQMVLTGLRPTEATLVTAISASADIAAVSQGRELHGLAWRLRFESNDRVKTALLDMYAKCGSLKVAQNLFQMLREKRIVSWNAMISGYAMHGHTNEALDLFDQMKEEKKPDHVTFVGVLSACSHGGLLDEGRLFFESMMRDYNIEPKVQHYTCMVDLLGHSDRLTEAYDLIRQIKVMPDSGIWGAFLNSCKIHRNMEFGELALEKLIELEPDDSGNYVILSNIYAQSGKWEKAAKLRKIMTDRGLKKTIACSWIDVKNKVHAFLSGDTFHPDSEAIYGELKRLEERMIAARYVSNTDSVFHDVDDNEKTSMVCSHSERLAIAFGLINTPPGTRLLITKNLKICQDCHVAIKFISKITKREIVVRDVNRYHHFREGSCSCGDYW